MAARHFISRKKSVSNFHLSNKNKGSFSSTASDGDPLDYALHPPSGETREEQKEREDKELEAKKRNEAIDKLIKEDASKMKTERNKEKTILLLGQSEAGKTTVLKQMRIMYSPERQKRFRKAWIDIVYLNVVVAIKELVNAFHKAPCEEDPASSPVLTTSSPPLSPLSTRSQTFPSPWSGSCLQKQSGGEPSSPTISQPSKRRLLTRLRLAPLLSTENELRNRLGAFEETSDRCEKRPTMSISGVGGSSLSQRCAATLLLKATWQEDWGDEECEQAETSSVHSSSNLSIISNAAKWTRVKLQLPSSRDGEPRNRSKSMPHSLNGDLLGEGCRPSNTEEQSNMQRLLSACLTEVQDLWLSVKMSECSTLIAQSSSAAYFLNNLSRIALPAFTPSDDDILHARVRTVGVYEERFELQKNLCYRIIDVGGSRTQRNVWAQFFSDATAIIFLAPLSTFDETLREDGSVNRLKDSFYLWEEVVSSPLLRQVSLILFLNKIDLLKDKLRAGIAVSDFFSRYEGNNSFNSVWRYFRNLFIAVYNKHRTDASRRSMYVYKTTATSTNEARKILSACQDIILKQHLKESALT